jgi:parallel beta-helix repeat protein
MTATTPAPIPTAHPTFPPTLTALNEVSHTEISDIGTAYPSAIGIWVGQSPANHLHHNHVHDTFYSAISIGWTWGFGPSLAYGNLVEHNHIHHVGIKQIPIPLPASFSRGSQNRALPPSTLPTSLDGPLLSDMGGIYTLGTQPGTIIRHNTFHDVAASNYGGWGIYADEGSTNILVENNLVYRTTHGGFHQHYGKENLVRNNIFAFARDAQIAHARHEGRREFVFERNIVYWDQGPLSANPIPDATFDHNLYYPTGQQPLLLGKTTWDAWRASGQDAHSLIADPLFTDPKHDDYRLNPKSPAEKVGFAPFTPAAAP